MKENITWFWAWEKRIWADKIETNRYLATLSILFAAIMGACLGGGRVFHEWFGWDSAPNVVALGYLLILILGMNFCETVVASKVGWVILWRSLLLMLCVIVAFAIGVIASVVVIFLTAAWLVLMLVGSLLSGSGSRSSSSRSGQSSGGVEQYGYDENGSQYTMRDIGGGYARDDNGRRWKNDGGSKWSLDE